MEKTVVYKCVVDGLIYIGITSNFEQRKKDHLRTIEKNIHRDLYAALNEAEDIEWSVVEECESYEIACEREKYWIAYYDSKSNGLNITSGGQGTYGSKRPKSEKWKVKHSKRMSENNPRSGIKLDDDLKQRISESVKRAHDEGRFNVRGENNGMFGKKHSAEWKDNQSKKMKEHHATGKYDAVYTKMADSRSKKWAVTDPNGYTQTIKNLSKFCRENNLSQSSMIIVSQGKQSNHKGWTVHKIKE